MASLIGRAPTPPVALPDVTLEAEAIAEWLKEHEGAQRKPEATARILALVVKLHMNGQLPWPTRQQVKDHLGVSLPMIDVVLSHRQATGHITIWTSTIEGNIKSRVSVVTRRHIQASDELIAVVQACQKNIGRLKRTKSRSG